MSILSVIKRVIIISEVYNKPVKDIDVVDGVLIVEFNNGRKFDLAYRFMTVDEIDDKITSACLWRE